MGFSKFILIGRNLVIACLFVIGLNIILFPKSYSFGQESARAEIMRIHSRKMTVDLDDVNFEELARCTEDFNGAQMKAVCVESGNTQDKGKAR